MTVTYDTLGSTVTIRAAGTTVTVGFNNDMAVVGGYNASEADSSVTPGTVYEVESESRARELFGTNSELAKQVASGVPNPVDTLHCIPVPETLGHTESVTGKSGGELDNVPFDPNIHPEHQITATDVTDSVSADVQITYQTSPETPSTSNTINLNPVTGQWAADASSDYEFTYDYGNYQTPIETAAAEPVRYVNVLTERTDLKEKGVTELEAEAQVWNFRRLIAGSRPDIDPTRVDDYQPPVEDWRLVEVAPSRGTLDDEAVRTTTAVGAYMSGQPINVRGSITYDDIDGLDSLRTEYRATEAGQFSQVTALSRSLEVAQGVTTSAVEAFQPIYQAEIVDTIAESLFEVEGQYLGGPNLKESRGNLRRALDRLLRSFQKRRPPLLASGDGSKAYTLTVSQGVDDDTASVDVGIEPAPIMQNISLDISVGEVTTFQGASVQTSV